MFETDSNSYLGWSVAVIIAYFVTCVNAPFTLCFGLLLTPFGYTIELILCTIYSLDIYVNYNSERFDGDVQLFESEARDLYLRREALIDILAAIPISLISAPLDLPTYVPGFFRALSLLKGYRVFMLIKLLNQNIKTDKIISTIVSSISFLILMTNIFTCIMYLICLWDHNKGMSYTGLDMVYFNVLIN